MMTRRIWRTAVVLALAPVLLTAWSAIGHMSVAYLAYGKLTPQTKARVQELLKLNPDFAQWEKQVPTGTAPEEHERMIFAMASVWADDIKGDQKYTDDGTGGGNIPGGPNSALNAGYGDLLRHKYWHFVDIPFTQDGTKLPEIPSPNVQTQIEAFRAVLKSDSPDQLKSYDLVWLLHLIGDVHQPLHATARITATEPMGDAGGNTVKLLGDASPNLHAYWDDLSGIDCQFCRNKANCIQRAIFYVKTLKFPSGKPAKNLSTAAWVQESFDDARKVVYQAPIGPGAGTYSIEPASAYDVRADKLARSKLALAAARMAAVLNEELK